MRLSFFTRSSRQGGPSLQQRGSWSIQKVSKTREEGEGEGYEKYEREREGEEEEIQKVNAW